MHTTSPTLLERLRRPNEPAAWARFVDLYSPLLYYWARRMGLQEFDAADLVQEIFALLLQKLPDFQYNAERTFRGWLRTVTINKCRERRRQEANRYKREQANPAPQVADDELDARWDEEYNRAVVGRAIEMLKGEFKPETIQACLAFVVEGKSAAEVAVQFGISEGAVRVAKFRVISRLRQELAGLLD